MQQQLADLTVGDRRPDLGAAHQLDDLPAAAGVDEMTRVAWARQQELFQTRQAGELTIDPVDVLAADRVETGAQIDGVQEDRRADIRGEAFFALLAGVVADQTSQPLRLAICQQVRVVLRREPCIRHPSHPLVAVTRELALPVLELQHEEATRGEHQSVDLVDRPVGAHELDVRPHVVGLDVGQVVGKYSQPVALMRERAGVDLLPAWRVCPHVPASLPPRGPHHLPYGTGPPPLGIVSS